MEEILGLVLAHGARMANPGEFTQRAFVNGRIDLAQAEAVMDVIQAKSRQGLTSAVNQLEGRLSKVIGAMRHDLTDFITRLEVTIDYPEEDLEDITVPDVAGAIRKQLTALDDMLENYHDGRIIRDGVMAAIAGTPNAGKSSLLNRLLQEDRAIVTDVPGTTRDVLEEWISLKGVPVCLVDTAGIRETDDTVEKIGVTKAKAYMDKADIILVVIDRSRSLSDEDKAILEDTKDKNVLVVLNKTDLMPVVTEKDLAGYGHPVLSLSAGTGDGLDSLKINCCPWPCPMPIRQAVPCSPIRAISNWCARAGKPCSGPSIPSKPVCPSTVPSSTCAKPGSFWARSRAIRSTTIWSKKYSADSV